MHADLEKVAFALAAWRAEKGGWPAKLGQLTPGYLKEVPADGFSGQPLIYRAAKGGYVLYSVGPNGVDDGGREAGGDPKDDDVVVKVPAEG